MSLRGFYGIVDAPDSLLAGVELAEKLVAGGATAVQVRMKRAGTRELIATCRAVKEVVAGRALFVVNDRIDVALLVGADAVHLGQDDLDLADARALRSVGAPGLAVGVSTHNLAQAEAAARAGADYLGFGPIFATGSKENPDPVQGLVALAEAVRRVAPVPIVAIGGITVEQAPAVIATGVACVCAIASVNKAADPTAAAAAIARAFSFTAAR